MSIAVSVMYVCDCLVMQIGLVPGLHVGMGDGGTGCFEAGGGLTRVSACQHRSSHAHTVFPTAKTRFTDVNDMRHCSVKASLLLQSACLPHN